MSELNIKVITQTSELLDEKADSITVPTVQGLITILPNHMNIVTLVSMGLITIKQDTQKYDILVNNGLVEVSNNNVLILSDEAVSSKDVVISEINAAIENAQKQIATPLPAPELIQLEKQLKFELFKKQFLENHSS